MQRYDVFLNLTNICAEIVYNLTLFLICIKLLCPHTTNIYLFLLGFNKTCCTFVARK